MLFKKHENNKYPMGALIHLSFESCKQTCLPIVEAMRDEMNNYILDQYNGRFYCPFFCDLEFLKWLATKSKADLFDKIIEKDISARKNYYLRIIVENLSDEIQALIALYQGDMVKVFKTMLSDNELDCIVRKEKENVI